MENLESTTRRLLPGYSFVLVKHKTNRLHYKELRNLKPKLLYRVPKEVSNFVSSQDCI